MKLRKPKITQLGSNANLVCLNWLLKFHLKSSQRTVTSNIFSHLKIALLFLPNNVCKNLKGGSKAKLMNFLCVIFSIKYANCSETPTNSKHPVSPVQKMHNFFCKIAIFFDWYIWTFCLDPPKFYNHFRQIPFSWIAKTIFTISQTRFDLRWYSKTTLTIRGR